MIDSNSTIFNHMFINYVGLVNVTTVFITALLGYLVNIGKAKFIWHKTMAVITGIISGLLAILLILKIFI